MFKFNSCKNSLNKENENRVTSSRCIKNTTKKYLTKSLKLKSPSTREINLKLGKKPLVEIRQINSANSPIRQNKSTHKLKSKKSHKEILKTNIITGNYQNTDTTSSSTPKQPESLTSHESKRIPKQFNLNKYHLKLKSPLEKESWCTKEISSSKSFVNQIHSSYNNDRSFDFFEEKSNSFQSVRKINVTKADREAFDLFSFPSKRNIKDCNHTDMVSSSHSAGVQMYASSNNKICSSIKVNLLSDCSQRESIIGETSANIGKSFNAEVKTLHSIKGMSTLKNYNVNKENEPKTDCFEESQFTSPILDNVMTAGQVNSTVTSPVLNHYHNDYCNHNEKNVNLKMKCIQSYDAVAEKRCDSKKQSKNDGSREHLLPIETRSPVLESSQRKKDGFKKRLVNSSFKSFQKPKLDMEDISPSPILDEIKLKESPKQLKPVLNGILMNPTYENNEEKNHQISKVTRKLTKTKKLQKAIFCKGENIMNENSSNKCKAQGKGNLATYAKSFVRLDSKAENGRVNINGSIMEPTKEMSQPLSQVLSSNNIFNSKLYGLNTTELKLENAEKPTCAAIVYKETSFQSSCAFKSDDMRICSIDKSKETTCFQSLNKLHVFSSHDEINITCSPVLDSGIQTLKCQESRPKECTGLRTITAQNCLDKISKGLEILCKEGNNTLLHVLAADPADDTEAINNVNILAGELKSCCDVGSKVEDMKSADYNHLNTMSVKRSLSPVRESPCKVKRKKPAANHEIEHVGPMLGSVLKSPGSDDVLCPSISNLDQDEALIYSPSFNSALDIRQFPLMLSDLPDNSYPKEKSGNVKSDNNCDTHKTSQNRSKDLIGECCQEEQLDKDSHLEQVEPSDADKTKKLLSTRSLTVEPITHPEGICSKEIMSPILGSGTCKKPNSVSVSYTNISRSSHSVSKENTQPENQFTDCISNSTTVCDRGVSGKRHVRKKLSLYFNNNEPKARSINDNLSKNLQYKKSNSSHLKMKRIDNKKKKPKLDLLDDEEFVCETQISGVENLQPIQRQQADNEKRLTSSTYLKNQSDTSEQKQIGSISNCRSGRSSKSVQSKKHPEDNNYNSLQQVGWGNQMQLFNDNDTDQICIEDFDEESPFRKKDISDTVPFEANEINFVKRNLNCHFKNNDSKSTKRLIPEAKSLLVNFEPDDQNHTCLQNLSSEESYCEVEIQEDFSQRTTDGSPAFRIEYSTTPTAKSSEETQNEVDVNPPSFPPALEVDVNTSPSAAEFDSASKSRRTRVKKDSLVERLRRLVRGQRAEVNMFHHEASASTRGFTRACLLSVTTATQASSLLVLNCRYMDAQRTTSQECGSGEEVVDPEVHVYVDPSYAKNIRAGRVITIFPPWHSVWYESRGVVLMYCVTKLQLETRSYSQSLPVAEPRWTDHRIVGQFSCQSQDESCGCRSQLVAQLFTAPQSSEQPHCGAITAALAGGWYPHRVKLKLTVLHCYQARSNQSQVQTRILCVDSSGHICQLNLHSEQDILKLGSLEVAQHKTFAMKKLSVRRRIFIDRCKGLRSFLTYLHPESSNQQMMYVAAPSDDDWTAQLVDESADSSSPVKKCSKRTCHQDKLLSLPINEDVEGRARAQVRVMAVRRDELFAWEPRLDLYIKMNVTSSASLPNFPARACLDMLYIWAYQGELTIDKFTKVSIVEAENEDFPSIPPLAVDSSEGDLVLLDSIVTKVSSDAYLRWEGSCGHKVLRVPKTGLYFCVTCRQTSASSTQKVVLEVCVVVMDIPHLIRVKVKSETARVLLADASGQISSEKSYNTIGVIGSTFKCLAVVAEVFRNSNGDIIEFILEEL